MTRSSSRTPSVQHEGTRSTDSSLGATEDSLAARVRDARPSHPSIERDRALRGLVKEVVGSTRDSIRVGRFEVLEEIGLGGMGSVVSAYDPRLGRHVALKFTHRRLGSRDLAQLRREARALAAVNHPHVLSIYDVGQWREHLYIVTARVEGVAFGRWLARRRRSWRRIVDVLCDYLGAVQAGHDVGVVHCDLKPSNLMVDQDGHGIVIDYGLARIALGDANRGDGSGRGAGTPHYMAPEQHRAEVPTPASDQFSLCVAAYEALYGVRPYPEVSDVDELRRFKEQGPARPPTRRLVPRRISEAILQGLALEPSQRHESLRDLENALRRPAPARRVYLIGLAGLALSVAGATRGSAAPVTAPPSEMSSPAPASPEDDELAEVQQIRELMKTGRLEGAQATVEALLARSDLSPRARAAALGVVGQVFFERSELDQAMRMHEEAHRIAWEAGAACEAARAASARVTAMVADKRWDTRLDTWIGHASSSAARCGDPEVLHNLPYLRGMAAHYRGDPQTARRELEESVRLAGELGEPAPHRVWQLSIVLPTEEAYEALTRVAEDISQRWGHRHPYRAITLNRLAGIELRRRHSAQARAATEEAISILTETWGPEHRQVAVAHALRARALRQQERYDEALVAIETACSGPYGEVMEIECESLAANILLGAGRPDEAEARFERLLVAAEGAYGPDDDRTLRLAIGLASAYVEAGEIERTERFMASMMPRMRQAATASTLAFALIVRGTVSNMGSRHAAALADFDEARALLIEANAPGNLAVALSGAVDAASGLGDTKLAVARAQEVVALADLPEATVASLALQTAEQTLERHRASTRATPRPSPGSTH